MVRPMTTKASAKKTLNLTDKGLADLLGISRQAVHQWKADRELDKRYRITLHALYPRKFPKPN